MVSKFWADNGEEDDILDFGDKEDEQFTVILSKSQKKKMRQKKNNAARSGHYETRSRVSSNNCSQ